MGMSPPDAPAAAACRVPSATTAPQREGERVGAGCLGFLGPFRRPVVPALFAGSGTRLEGLIRDGKLYLTLDDAIALALENNLDVEAERYNLTLAKTDVARAAGGGSLRGIDYGCGGAERCGRAGVAAAECGDGEYEPDDADGDRPDSFPRPHRRRSR